MHSDPKNWKTHSTKVLLDHEQLKISEDIVELPDGVRRTYVRHAPSEVHSVAIIAVNGEGEVLVQREYSHPPNKIMWQLPGGSMNPGESIEEAALRELAEESGFSARKTDVLGYYFVHNRLSDKKQHVVLCTGLYEHKLREDFDEFIATHWIRRAELVRNIGAGEYDNINLLAALNIWLCRQSVTGR
jgi:ADP-ribose pyrophosphatase